MKDKHDIHKEDLWVKILKDERMPKKKKKSFFLRFFWLGLFVMITLIFSGLYMYSDFNNQKISALNNESSENSDLSLNELAPSTRVNKPTESVELNEATNTGVKPSNQMEEETNDSNIDNHNKIIHKKEETTHSNDKLNYESKIRKKPLSQQIEPRNLHHNENISTKISNSKPQETINRPDSKLSSQDFKTDNFSTSISGNESLKSKGEQLDQKNQPSNNEKNMNSVHQQSIVRETMESRKVLLFDFLSPFMLDKINSDQPRSLLSQPQLTRKNKNTSNKKTIFFTLGYGFGNRNSTDNLGTPFSNTSPYIEGFNSYQFELGTSRKIGPIQIRAGLGADIIQGSELWMQVDTLYTPLIEESTFLRTESTTTSLLYQRYGNIYVMSSIDYRFEYDRWSILPRLGIKYHAFSITNGSTYSNELSETQKITNISPEQKLAFTFGLDVERKITDRFYLTLGMKRETSVSYSLHSDLQQSIAPLYLTLGGHYGF